MDMTGIGILQHYGILGMRWGYRRERGKDGLVKGKAIPSEDFLKAQELRKKGTSSLTNAELKALNERLQMERQFKTLSKQDLSPGKKLVQEVFYNSLKTYATSVAGEGWKEIGRRVAKTKK